MLGVAESAPPLLAALADAARWPPAEERAGGRVITTPQRTHAPKPGGCMEEEVPGGESITHMEEDLRAGKHGRAVRGTWGEQSRDGRTRRRGHVWLAGEA